MLEILFVGGIIVLLVFAFIALSMRKGKPDERAATDDETYDGVVGDPMPVARTIQQHAAATESEDAKRPATHAITVRWTKQFETGSGELSDEARLKLINDLGLLGAAWCVPLLMEAYEQETDLGNRLAIEHALARCRSNIGASTPAGTG